MPSTATAGRTSFLPFAYSSATTGPATNAGIPLFQAFSHIPVQRSTYCDCIKVGVKIEDLLVQVMLDLGVLLSSKVEKTEVAGKKVFSVADGYLIACFDNDVTDGVVTAIAKRHSFYAVFRDSSMANDSVAANFEQIFATFSPQTVRKVL